MRLFLLILTESVCFVQGSPSEFQMQSCERRGLFGMTWSSGHQHWSLCCNQTCCIALEVPSAMAELDHDKYNPTKPTVLYCTLTVVIGANPIKLLIKLANTLLNFNHLVQRQAKLYVLF